VTTAGVDRPSRAGQEPPGRYPPSTPTTPPATLGDHDRGVDGSQAFDAAPPTGRGRGPVGARVARAIERQIGVRVRVELSGRRLTLTGRVDSPAAKAAAADVARHLAPRHRVLDELLVVESGPGGARDLAAPLPPEPVVTPLEVEAEEALSALPAAMRPETGPLVEDGVVDEAGERLFPPTDPVVGADHRRRLVGTGRLRRHLHGRPERRGVEPGRAPGDEALAAAVRRELREDAATTDLAIEVAVRVGVVQLRGAVAGLEDADSAQEVASQVPGVVEVVDDLVIAAL
jgi:hypothetical protein